MSYTTKDSGERVEFETGSRRDTNKGKTRPSLIGPELKRRLGDLMARGAEKYGDGNWRLGQKVSRYLDSLERHLLQWEEGDDTEDHLAAIVFNVMGVMHLEKHMPEHLDHERYELAKTHPDNLLMQQHEVQFVDIAPIENPLINRSTVVNVKTDSEELAKTIERLKERIRVKTDEILIRGDAPNVVTGSQPKRGYCRACRRWHDRNPIDSEDAFGCTFLLRE